MYVHPTSLFSSLWHTISLPFSPPCDFNLGCFLSTWEAHSSLLIVGVHSPYLSPKNLSSFLCAIYCCLPSSDLGYLPHTYKSLLSIQIFTSTCACWAQGVSPPPLLVYKRKESFQGSLLHGSGPEEKALCCFLFASKCMNFFSLASWRTAAALEWRATAREGWSRRQRKESCTHACMQWKPSFLHSSRDSIRYCLTPSKKQDKQVDNWSRSSSEKPRNRMHLQNLKDFSLPSSDLSSGVEGRSSVFSSLPSRQTCDTWRNR